MKVLAGQWWQMSLILALGRQKQVDFWVWGQPGIQSEFQDSQDYTEKPYLKKQKKKKKVTLVGACEVVWRSESASSCKKLWVWSRASKRK